MRRTEDGPSAPEEPEGPTDQQQSTGAFVSVTHGEFPYAALVLEDVGEEVKNDSRCHLQLQEGCPCCDFRDWKLHFAQSLSIILYIYYENINPFCGIRGNTQLLALKCKFNTEYVKLFFVQLYVIFIKNKCEN